MKNNSGGYDFPRKQAWREAAWIEVLSRVEKVKPIGECNVLYLAGWDNADLPTATALGVDPKKMIAVECFATTASHLRGNGQLTIVGALRDVCAHWPDKRTIDVVYADLCDGFRFDDAADFFMDLASSDAFVRATILVNLQRGRDEAESVSLLTHGDKHRGRAMYAMAAACADFGMPEEHRAKSRVDSALLEYRSVRPSKKERERRELWQRYSGKIDPALNALSDLEAGIVSYCHAQLDRFDPRNPWMVILEPWFTAYRGRHVWFDTVVMHCPTTTGYHRHNTDAPLRRQISAVLASQTRALTK